MKSLTGSDFSDAVSKGNAVVDFWAPWCGPCRIFAPVFEKVAQKHEGILFAKLNTEEAPEVAQDARVRAIPTLIFYKDGKEIDRVAGAMPESQFEQKLKAVFGAPSPIEPDEEDEDDDDSDDDEEFEDEEFADDDDDDEWEDEEKEKEK